MRVEFVLSAHGAGQFPRDRLPEVAFVGRSNVGKSSLLNALARGRHRRRGGRTPVRRKDLARISQTPGRTRAINFFRIDGRLYFVDLPGYGYARVPAVEQERWKLLAEAYLTGRSALRLVVLIIDLRHGPTVLDRQMRDWLEAMDVDFCVVGSKSDKLKQGARLRSVAWVSETFPEPIPFSAVTGLGVPRLWRAIESSLAA